MVSYSGWGMDRRKTTIVLIVVVILVSSIISGYVIDFLTHRSITPSVTSILTVTPSLRGLTIFESEIKQLEAITTPSKGISEVGIERETAERIQEYMTTYSDQGRLISYTAEISLQVPRKEVKNSLDKILSIVSVYGGYVSSMNVEEDTAYLVSKIPQESLFNFLDDVSRIGEVENKVISGTDLTDKIIDLRARIRNAEAVESRLLELLDKAENISEILEVMKELSKIREEIETMKAQLKNLELSTSYSTVSIKISEKMLRKEYVEVVFRVLDSREFPVPGTLIFVKDGGEVRRPVTDEFGEAKTSLEKNANVSLIAVFYRSDGETLKTSLTDVADSNKTITIRFNKPYEPPLISLEKLASITSSLLNYLTTGLIFLAIFIIPLSFITLSLIGIGRRIYAKIKKT